MKNDWFKFDRNKQQITIQVNGGRLMIDKNNTDISYFSGGPGGQNVNRNLKGVQLIFRIPEEFRHTSQKTRQLITRVMGKRSLHHNTEEAFQQLSHKVHAYFYVPPIRKKTKTSKRAKEKRLSNKKIHSQKKECRKSINY